MKPIREDLAKRFTAIALERGGDPEVSLEAIVESIVQQHERSSGDPAVLPWNKFAHNLHLRFAQVFGAQDVTPTPTSRICSLEAPSAGCRPPSSARRSLR